MRSVCASNYHNNYWNHIVYKKYEERIIKQRVGIPAIFRHMGRTWTSGADRMKEGTTRRTLEGQELSGERMDRRTRCRQYRIDLSEWTQLPTEGPDLLSGRGTDWGFLMPTMVAVTLYDGSGPATRAEIEAARSARCRVALLTQLSERWKRP